MLFVNGVIGIGKGIKYRDSVSSSKQMLCSMGTYKSCSTSDENVTRSIHVSAFVRVSFCIILDLMSRPMSMSDEFNNRYRA